MRHHAAKPKYNRAITAITPALGSRDISETLPPINGAATLLAQHIVCTNSASGLTWLSSSLQPYSAKAALPASLKDHTV